MVGDGMVQAMHTVIITAIGMVTMTAIMAVIGGIMIAPAIITTITTITIPITMDIEIQ